MIILIGRKPARATYAKVKDHDKVIASSQVRSTWGIQSLKDLRFGSISKSKIQNMGNSKLLGRITVIVFNVPSHIFTIFQNFQRSVEPCHWQVTTQFIKFEPVPTYLEPSFILFAQFILSLMAILKAKNFKIQKNIYIF